MSDEQKAPDATYYVDYQRGLSFTLIPVENGKYPAYQRARQDGLVKDTLEELNILVRIMVDGIDVPTNGPPPAGPDSVWGQR